jgi:hypothetical protein
MKLLLLSLAITLTVSATGAQVSRTAPPPNIPRIIAAPLHEIAATSSTGRVLFERAGGAALLVPTGMVLADRGSNRLIRFDGRGALVGSSGGTGQGPGEFSLLWAAVACRGMITGVEIAGTAVQEFTVDGIHRRSVTLAAGLLAEQAPVCVAGQLAGMTQPRPEAGGSADSPVRTMTARIAVFDSSGATTRQTPPIPAGEYLVQGGGGMPRPLAPQLVFAALPGGAVAFGTGADSAVSVLQRDGTVRSFALPLRRRAPGTPDRVAAIDAILAMAPAVVHDRVRQVLEAAPTPTWLPLYRGMLSQPDGTLWLDTSAPGDAVMEWTVVRNSRIVGTVRLPVAGKVLSLTSDRIVILRENEDGEEVVGVYRVES